MDDGTVAHEDIALAAGLNVRLVLPDIMEAHDVRLEALGLGDAKARLVRAVEEANAFSQQHGIEEHPIFVDRIQRLQAADEAGTAENQQIFPRLAFEVEDLRRRSA